MITNKTYIQIKNDETLVDKWNNIGFITNNSLTLARVFEITIVHINRYSKKYKAIESIIFYLMLKLFHGITIDNFKELKTEVILIINEFNEFYNKNFQDISGIDVEEELLVIYCETYKKK